MHSEVGNFLKEFKYFIFSFFTLVFSTFLIYITDIMQSE